MNKPPKHLLIPIDSDGSVVCAETTIKEKSNEGWRYLGINSRGIVECLEFVMDSWYVDYEDCDGPGSIGPFVNQSAAEKGLLELTCKTKCTNISFAQREPVERKIDFRFQEIGRRVWAFPGDRPNVKLQVHDIDVDIMKVSSSVPLQNGSMSTTRSGTVEVRSGGTVSSIDPSTGSIRNMGTITGFTISTTTSPTDPYARVIESRNVSPTIEMVLSEVLEPIDEAEQDAVYIRRRLLEYVNRAEARPFLDSYGFDFEAEMRHLHQEQENERRMQQMMRDNQAF